MKPHVVFLCTGNAARSVMAATMFRSRTDDAYRITSSGTFVIPGLPMSQRTRKALERHDLVDREHRSDQFEAPDTRADLIVAMEPEHIEWLRRTHDPAVDKAATLKRLVRDLPGTSGPLAQRVAALRLETVELEAWEEIIDPAGGDQPDFDLCADEIAGLIDALVSLLAPPRL